MKDLQIASEVPKSLIKSAAEPGSPSRQATLDGRLNSDPESNHLQSMISKGEDPWTSVDLNEHPTIIKAKKAVDKEMEDGKDKEPDEDEDDKEMDYDEEDEGMDKSISGALSRLTGEDISKGYIGFKKLSKEIGKKGKVSDPDAVAAAIGRKKYGKAEFQRMAAAGRKKKSKKSAKKSLAPILVDALSKAYGSEWLANTHGEQFSSDADKEVLNYLKSVESIDLLNSPTHNPPYPHNNFTGKSLDACEGDDRLTLKALD